MEIIVRIIEQRLKETMTVVAKIETDRVIEVRVSDELVNRMVGWGEFAIGGTYSFASIMGIV